MILPGAGHGGYVRLRDIVAKGILAAVGLSFIHQGNGVFVEGRQLQGLVIAGDYVRITGVHYTSWERATQLRLMVRIEPSLNDPFVYISESGRMQDWPQEQIRRELGSLAADTEVRLTSIVPLGRVWIKASRAVVHYAIAGIVTADDIKSLTIHRRTAS